MTVVESKFQTSDLADPSCTHLTHHKKELRGTKLMLTKDLTGRSNKDIKGMSLLTLLQDSIDLLRYALRKTMTPQQICGA